MARRTLRLPSPSLTIALLALFVALGGTGYAALSLPKNSVGSKQLRKGAVKNSDIAANAVTGSKVKRRSLSASDFKSGSLPQGPRGLQGPKGNAGNPAGAAVLGRGNGVTTGAWFMAPSGLATASTNENNVSSFTPNNTITASNLAVTLTVAPGLGDSRTFTLRVGNANTALTCTVPGGTVTCTSTGSITIPEASLISLGATSTGAPSPTDVRFGWRASS
jgi:hypothetical protein